MKIADSYPYPVLDQNTEDYIDSIFEVEYKVIPVFGELKINLSLKLKNPGIEALINKGAATFTLHVECPQTSYRRMFKHSENVISETIPLSTLRGKIFIHTFILAETKIEKYTNELLSDWFKNVNLTFEKGYIMGIAEAIEIIVPDDNTDLLEFPSIIDIHRSIEGEYMEVDMYSQNIIISLPASEYDVYARNGDKKFKSTIIAAVIFPALISIFGELKGNVGEFEEHTWYQVMDKTFKDNNYDLTTMGKGSLTPLKAAQLVLRKPLSAALSEIQNNMSEEEE
ncbi:hypothetical protein [Planococcus maitriensis]|uniref:Uncharacterized protein n=1 Tax=Planococcus maitriensis TaxID=221799 RepID=A0A365K8Q3_9BACL|nr:hypothetical protein [Planococcus maitriensis]RAZ69183.1 hypothetical protein DP119_00525 [Planococcus maitriensis]